MGKKHWGFVCVAALCLSVNLSGVLTVMADDGVLFEEEDYTLWLDNCQDTMEIADSEYDPKTDWDWSYFGGDHVSFIAKGENGYYVRLRDYVYFCDFNREKLVPLCSRPDCLHDEETDQEKIEECLAYVKTGSVGRFSGIQYYDGKYYVNYSIDELTENLEMMYGDDLYEISADGSSREKMHLNMEDASRFFIHRGDVYYITHITDVQNLTEIEALYRMPLDGGKKTKIAEVDGRAILNAYAYGDYIYIYAGMNSLGNELIYDIKTQEIYAEKFTEEMTAIYRMPWQDGYLGMNSGTNSLVYYSPDLSETEVVCQLALDDPERFGLGEDSDLNLGIFISADHQYMYMMGDIDGESDAVAIYDMENWKLKQLIPIECSACQCIGVGDDDIFYADPDQRAVYWLKKSEMFNEGVQFNVMVP